MRNLIIPGLAAVGLLVTLESGTAWAAPDCTDPKHADKPACTDGGGDDGGGGGIATNDITARWSDAATVYGTGSTPRECTLHSQPQPNGTHTAYTCVQEPAHTVSVILTGGVVLNTKGKPSPPDSATCTTGFAFEVYPNTQYIVAVGGEICTDADGCPLTVHNSIYGQNESTGYDFVKLLGRGRVPQSENLNPFACPADGSSPSTQLYPIDTVEVAVRNGSSSKADLVCLFDVAGTTSFQVTPVCD